MKIFNINYKYIENVIFIFAGLLMVTIPCTHYYLLKFDGYNDVLSYVIYLNVSGLFLTVLIGIFLNNNVKYDMCKYDYILIVLILLSVFSTLSSLDMSSSFWGWSGRNEGLLMLVAYYSIFYSLRFLKSFKLRKQIILGLIITGLLHSLYGILQKYGLFSQYIFALEEQWYGIKGLTGNQNFMATFLVLISGVIAGLFYFSDKFYKQFLYLIILLFVLVTLVLTKTMSGLFGVALMVLIFFIYLYVTKGKHKQFENSKYLNSFNLMVLAFGVGIVGLIILNSLMNGYLVKEFNLMFSQLNQMIGSGEITEDMGSGRFIVWKNSLGLLSKYWLYGCGIDVFGIAYTNTYGLMNGIFFDKVHNEYLQIAITMGIPALCMYLTLYGNVIVDSIKRLCDILTTEGRENEEGMYVGIGLAIIGYLAQAFFNISVIDVAPYFWILLGLAADNSNIKVKTKRKLAKPKYVIVNKVAHIITEEEVFE